MFIPDPDFYPSRIRISDPKTAAKEGGEKKYVVIPRIIQFFTQNTPSSQKYGFGIRDPEKTYSGSRVNKKHRILDPQTGCKIF
jgi:hypothetical protein